MVDHAEVLRVRHAAAAERVRRVDALGLGELEEAGEPVALHDLLDRGVGGLAHPDRLLGLLVLEQTDRHGAAVRTHGRPRRRHGVELAVVRVLDHGQHLDVVVPCRDRMLLVEAPPARLGLGRAPVVVEEVRQARQEDLL